MRTDAAGLGKKSKLSAYSMRVALPELEALVHGAPHAVEILDEDVELAPVIEAADQKPRRCSGDGHVEAGG